MLNNYTTNHSDTHWNFVLDPNGVFSTSKEIAATEKDAIDIINRDCIEIYGVAMLICGIDE